MVRIQDLTSGRSLLRKHTGRRNLALRMADSNTLLNRAMKTGKYSVLNHTTDNCHRYPSSGPLDRNKRPICPVSLHCRTNSWLYLSLFEVNTSSMLFEFENYQNLGLISLAAQKLASSTGFFNCFYVAGTARTNAVFAQSRISITDAKVRIDDFNRLQ